ncbi:core histone macro-H2A.1-like [Carcharodon carcharias]|uniref:core histone macro-H2A.1-like n=1 Tax=Carcharodon carcharias TaxID=13397 RepID=UPI001B7E3B77|nr:core histone macro-H2A.1-like [Carcharodon carcharias]
MSGRSKTEGKGQAKTKTCSSRTGLQFPVGRIHWLLRKGHYAECFRAGAPVYLAAVLEYLTAEILNLDGNVAQDNRKNGIIPCHLQLTIHNVEELNKLLGGVTIPQGGVLPNMQAVLLPKKTSHPSDQTGCRREEYAVFLWTIMQNVGRNKISGQSDASCGKLKSQEDLSWPGWGKESSAEKNAHNACECSWTGGGQAKLMMLSCFKQEALELERCHVPRSTGVGEAGVERPVYCDLVSDMISSGIPNKLKIELVVSAGGTLEIKATMELREGAKVLSVDAAVVPDMRRTSSLPSQYRCRSLANAQYTLPGTLFALCP